MNGTSAHGETDSRKPQRTHISGVRNAPIFKKGMAGMEIEKGFFRNGRHTGRSSVPIKGGGGGGGNAKCCTSQSSCVTQSIPFPPEPFAASRAGWKALLSEPQMALVEEARPCYTETQAPTKLERFAPFQERHTVRSRVESIVSDVPQLKFSRVTPVEKKGRRARPRIQYVVPGISVVDVSRAMSSGAS